MDKLMHENVKKKKKNDYFYLKKEKACNWLNKTEHIIFR